jgi:hypothetical protein
MAPLITNLSPDPSTLETGIVNTAAQAALAAEAAQEGAALLHTDLQAILAASGGGGGGGLTDAQLRATPVPVSGTVTASGPLTDAQLRASRVPVDGSGVTQPVSGTFFQATQPVSAASLPLPSGASTEATLALIKAKTDNLDVALSTRTKPADAQHVIVDSSASVGVTGPLTDTQLRATAVPVSGTVTASGPLTDTQLRASRVPVDASGVAVPVTDNAGSLTVDQATPANLQVTATPIALTKGSQGATGFTVQNLKDAGRTYVTLTAIAAAGVTSEALLSFSQNKQGAVTGSVTSYVIPSGKTLRITAISVQLKSAAAAIAFARCVLRHNTAGAATASSPVVFIVPEVNTNSATSGTGANVVIAIPDGLEFFGNGTQAIGMSHLDQATTNILNVTICGYEY